MDYDMWNGNREGRIKGTILLSCPVPSKHTGLSEIECEALLPTITELAVFR
jgi:hypothetical protein